MSEDQFGRRDFLKRTSGLAAGSALAMNTFAKATSNAHAMDFMWITSLTHWALWL